MKTLYVHIGMPKTGSNAIRNFCQKNGALLEKKGCRYLKTSEEVFGSSQDDADFSAGVQTVCEVFQNFDKILLSDNEMWYGIGKDQNKLWTSLAQTAGQEGFRVCVIAYFLQRDAFLYSLRDQMKWDCEPGGKSFEEYMEVFGMSERLPYYQKLDQISDLIGKENVTVLRVDEKNIKNRKVYEDLLKAVGLFMTNEYSLPKNVKNNGSYPEIHGEKSGSYDMVQMRDDVIRFSGTMAIYFHQKQMELEREIKDVVNLRHPFRWLFCQIRKKMKRK